MHGSNGPLSSQIDKKNDGISSSHQQPQSVGENNINKTYNSAHHPIHGIQMLEASSHMAGPSELRRRSHNQSSIEPESIQKKLQHGQQMDSVQLFQSASYHVKPNSIPTSILTNDQMFRQIQEGSSLINASPLLPQHPGGQA